MVKAKWGILLLMLLSSCITHKTAKELYGCKEIESTTKTDTSEQVREVPVFVPGDSATIFIPAELDFRSNWGGSITGKGSQNASVKATYNPDKKGYVVVANCDSLTKVIQAKDRVISTFKSSIVKQEQEKKSWLSRKVDGVTSFIVKFFAVLGVLFVLYIAMRLSLFPTKLNLFK
jgi:hypothetical protein